jgi:hypothetical protein
MLDFLASGQNKLSDPILMKWALRRFQHTQTLGSERCHDMERAWFHDISLRHWIDSDDHDVLAHSLRAAGTASAVVRAQHGRSGAKSPSQNLIKDCKAFAA